MPADTKNLRTGNAVWTEYPRPRFASSRLTSHAETDILIVGAGISGAMMAEALTGHGLDVVIVDAKAPLTGSTAASTALLQFELDEPLVKLSEKIGWNRAARGWRRSKIGLESLAVKIRDLNLDCAFERRESLYLAGNILDKRQLEDEAKLRSLIGLPGCILSAKKLKNDFAINGKGALLSRDNIAVNPVHLAAGFLHAALKKGATLYSKTQIVLLDRKKNFTDAMTDDGKRIRARHVVFAAGYDIPDFIKVGRHSISSTWALSTRPVKELPENYPFIWESSDPYCYGRSTIDGRMIFGGEDEPYEDDEKRDAAIPSKIARLEAKMKNMFPDFDFTTEHVWAGSFGSSGTGLPYIGRIPRAPNCYAVMGFGGNGITFSKIASEIIASQILDYKDPDEDLFSLSNA